MVLPVQWLDEDQTSYVVLVAPFRIFSGRYMYRFVGRLQRIQYKVWCTAGPTWPSRLRRRIPDKICLPNPARYPIYVIFDASVVQIYKELHPRIEGYTWDDVHLFLSNRCVLKKYDNGESQVDLIFGN